MRTTKSESGAKGSAIRDLLIVTDRDLARLAALRPHAQLQHELDRANVVSSEAVPGDVVTMNSHVLYMDEATGERRSVTIVYPDDADPSHGKISVLAPVGAALLGMSRGQSIEWEFPGGWRRLRVEEVIYQPESSGRYAAALDRRVAASRNRG